MTNVSNIRMVPIFIPSEKGFVNANSITRITRPDMFNLPTIEYKVPSGIQVEEISQETFEQLTEGKSLDIEA